MSLLDAFAHPCVRLECRRAPGGEGGWSAAWADGSAFVAYQALDTSAQVRRAEQQGVASSYTVLVDRSCPIAYGDYYRDTSTGVTYRVTSHPDEAQSPGCASFALKRFTAERQVPPE